MGIEGIAVAVAVVLLVVIVVPALYRSRAAVAQAPADERFAPDLRMITVRSYARTENSEYRCRIFTSERVMESNSKPSKAKAQNEHISHVRALARTRAQARAGIAARRALRVRFVAAGALLVAVTAILWVLRVSVNLPIGVPVGASVVLAIYIGGFIYLARMWYQFDAEDNATIFAVEEELNKEHAGAQQSAKRAVKVTKAKGAKAAKVKVAKATSKRAGAASTKRPTAAEEPALAAHSAVTPQPVSVLPAAADATRTRPRVVMPKAAPAAGATKTAAASTAKTATGTAPARPAPKIIVPTYTLKPAFSSAPDAKSDGPAAVIAPREVRPYEPPAAAEAPVPYRPLHMGERIGDVPPEAPNEAPKMGGESPVSKARNDVLGVGNTLDSLLDRRRA